MIVLKNLEDDIQRIAQNNISLANEMNMPLINIGMFKEFEALALSRAAERFGASREMEVQSLEETFGKGAANVKSS